MHKALKVVIALPAALFLFMGLRWLIAPDAAAVAQLMPLLDGMALSSQIADIGALFLGMATMIFLGLITENRTWLQATAMLLVMVAVYRIAAWLFHDASLAPKMIVVEIVVASLLTFAASKLKDQE